MTITGGDSKCFASSKLDKKAGEKLLENTEAKFPPLKYANQTPIMAVTGKSAYLVRVSIGEENNIMHPLTCLPDIGAQPDLISDAFLRTNQPSDFGKEMQPSLLSTFKRPT